MRTNALQRNKPLLVMAVTSHINMLLFQGQVAYLQKAGFDVAVVCSPGWANSEGAQYYPVVMEREIAILRDLRSLMILIRLFRRIRPDIVNAGTPKAGLLAGMAAFICKVPVRIYTCHGLRLETLAGWKRVLLTATEKIAAFCAHKVVCVSNSLYRMFIQLNLAPADKVTVIGAGGCNGIDVHKFTRKTCAYKIPDHIRRVKSICPSAVFIGFMGRFTKDKGIAELVAAFNILKGKFPNLYLLLGGEFEKGDPVPEKTRRQIAGDDRIVKLGFVADTVPYYQLMHIFVFPTYREGLPTVLLEAGSMEIPVVAARATGCIDVVQDGETGLLVPIGDSAALAAAVERLLNDKALAAAMGQKARQCIQQLYQQETIWHNTAEFYKSLLHGHSIPAAGGEAISI